jgi:serine kinase of HPr protein (carbohydrate metabolism regulator)
VGVAAMIVCNNRPIPEDMIAAAREESVGILVSDRNQFEISGELFRIIAAT